MALPGGIIALMLLMIVPVPAILLDISFVLNIALSVAVLMAAMNAQSRWISRPFRRSCYSRHSFASRSTSRPPASCWSTATKAVRRQAM